MKFITVLSIAIIVLLSGCAQQEPVTELYIPGHGDQIYTFANDIRESLLVKTNDADGIKAIGKSLAHLNIAYNGSDLQDVGYFRIVVIDIGAKVPTYYAYEGKIITFDYFYFVGDTWYNATAEEIEKPSFSQPTLWLSGPSTGANETSLTLERSIVYLRGSSYKGLRLAGDKFVLLLFGIDKI